jgi:hypothetical protein
MKVKRTARLANINVESIVNDSLMRKLDSSGFIDRGFIAARESSETQVLLAL